MSFKIGIIVCLILMSLIACITYYLGKKVSKSLMKYIPVFSLAIGVLFFYIKLNFIPYPPNSYDSIYDMIILTILIIGCSLGFLETIIIDIVENSNLFGKSYMAIRNKLKLVKVNKAFKFKMPSRIVKKLRS
ncbi:hypothetical protein [Psychrobacillus soli]|uniref:Uncharacterized protein n=1 Tax=Psychrobacillus soli TaxID=1543965 RepID=A0A544TJA3_9BACI|nr:hypothetical protein [Psychrobacillus soli]TQR17478.1 hypothetical protein FG383_05345 [Psychrobacillus soli]